MPGRAVCLARTALFPMSTSNRLISIPFFLLASCLSAAGLTTFDETFSSSTLDHPARWTDASNGGQWRPTTDGIFFATTEDQEFSHATLRTSASDAFWGKPGARYRLKLGKNAFTTSDPAKNSSIRLYLTGNTTTPTYDKGDANVVWVVLIRQPGPVGAWDLSLWVKTGASGKDWYESGKPRIYLTNIGSPNGLTLELTLREVPGGTQATLGYDGVAPETTVFPSIANSFNHQTWLSFGYYNGDGGPLRVSGFVAGASLASF